jgi:hypothetical protein
VNKFSAIKLAEVVKVTCKLFSFLLLVYCSTFALQCCVNSKKINKQYSIAVLQSRAQSSPGAVYPTESARVTLLSRLIYNRQLSNTSLGNATLAKTNWLGSDVFPELQLRQRNRAMSTRRDRQ